MLENTLTLGGIDFVKRNYNGTSSVFAPEADAPATERTIRVSHEKAKNGKVINTLFAISQPKIDGSTPGSAPTVAAVQVKIIRPAFVASSDMVIFMEWVAAALQTTELQAQLLNQEV